MELAPCPADTFVALKTLPVAMTSGGVAFGRAGCDGSM